MINEVEMQKYLMACQNCNADIKKPFEEKGYIYDTWANEKIKYCKFCHDEVMKGLHQKYFVEEFDGIGIYKHNNQYYFGLFSGMNANSLEDARLIVKGVINKVR